MATGFLIHAALAVLLACSAVGLRSEGIAIKHLSAGEALQACKAQIRRMLADPDSATIPDVAPRPIDVGSRDPLYYWSFDWSDADAIVAPHASPSGRLAAGCGVNWTNGKVKFVTMDRHAMYMPVDEMLVPPWPARLTMPADNDARPQQFHRIEQDSR